MLLYVLEVDAKDEKSGWPARVREGLQYLERSRSKCGPSKVSKGSTCDVDWPDQGNQVVRHSTSLPACYAIVSSCFRNGGAHISR
jgi:hypothetical protein